jgi:hypothetical protein
VHCRQFVYYAIEKMMNLHSFGHTSAFQPTTPHPSSINARKMNARYMLVAQANLLPGTSLTADADGNKVLEIRYKACPLRYTAGVLREGEIRATWTSSPSTTPAYKMPLY